MAVTVVGIGASAGGLEALKALFHRTPADSGLAFVVVMHLSPDHDSHLAELLQQHAPIPVEQVTSSVEIEKNHVYVIPPGANLEAVDTHLRLGEFASDRERRAPIDHFFRTLAESHDADAIAIVLTGTGADGTLGIREIKHRGGLTIVQDPGEAEYDAMPQSAIATGVVDFVLPISRMPGVMMRYARTRPKLRIPEDDDEPGGDESLLLQRVFGELRARTGRDFTRYRRSTMLRRIERRMQLNEIEDAHEYLALLRRDAVETRALADDLLITVTSFFRDSEMFAALSRDFLPSLFAGRHTGDGIRVWSAGCATGEEAYSLAMLLLEEAERCDEAPRIQIFASDLHERSLKTAREGFYPGDIESDVSPARLHRFFVRENGGFRVRKELREVIVFAPHNLLSDPPFSRIDLIACRNLMIHLERRTQADVVGLFHYALRPDGCLVLGGSETAEPSGLFSLESEDHRIYRKRGVRGPEPRLASFPPTRPLTRLPRSRDDARGRPDSGGLHHQLVESYAQPSALLAPDGRVIHVSENAGRYLVHPGGEPTSSILALVRSELRAELHDCLQRAGEFMRPARSNPIALEIDGSDASVVLDVRPAPDRDTDGLTLVFFDEKPLETEAAHSLPGDTAEDERSVHERALRTELDLTRQRLHALTAEYQSVQEEMRASHEELQSTNEELRSTLEELETSKQELQSINEELQLVNQENRHKVEELARLSSDLQNLLNATDIAMLFLDRDLRILRYSPRAAKLFSMRMADRGRPLSDLTHRLAYDLLQTDAGRVLEQSSTIEREIRDEAGNWYLTRLLPYLDSDGDVKGVVVTFVEMNRQKTAELGLRRAKEVAEQIIETLPEPLLVLNASLEIEAANAAFLEDFAMARAEPIGSRVYELGNGQWDIPELRRLLEELLTSGAPFRDVAVEHEFESLGRRVLLLSGRKVEPTGLLLLGIHDVTERHEVLLSLRRSEERLQRMINVEGIGVLVFDAHGTLIESNQAFLDMVGYSNDDVASGKLTWRAMTVPEHIVASERQIENLARTGRVGPYEKEYLRADGSRSWMLFVGASLGDGTVVEYCLDINDRKQMEAELAESRRRSESELNAMNRLHDLVSRLLVCPDMNSALTEVLAASIEIVGTRQGAVHITDDESRALDLVEQRGFDETALEQMRRLPLTSRDACARAVREGRRVVVEDVDSDPEGAAHRSAAASAGFRALQATPLIGRSGAAVGVLSTFYAEPHRPSESELRFLDLYARQAADFIEHVRQSELAYLANRRKDEFIATLAHELRNPLAPISMGLELLRSRADDSAIIDSARRTMRRQLDQLIALVDDLLDVSRIARGLLSLKLRDIDIRDVVASAVEEVRHAIDKAGHDLKVELPDGPIQLAADPHRLAQVLSNLLHNAAKFTPSGGEIRLAARREAAAVVITVEDDGIGIAPGMTEKIFGMFGQTDRPRLHAASGLGIGLTLVKSLTELHGGSVDVHSDGEGQGALFTVRLPVPQQTSLIEADDPAEHGDPSGIRVLVADDSKPAADLLAMVLESLGSEVCVAYDGDQATKLASTFQPDAVIMDISMPRMDGYAAARQIRSQPWADTLTLIALTGRGNEDDKKKAREAGFDYHLVKPVKAVQLRAVLAKAKRRRTQ